MDNLTAGNPRAHAVRVYYESESTIYEGMPVCYNYDTTDNWFGGSVSDGLVSATGTTAEGSQCEGKYIRVEDPADNNIMSFAGVVKKGGWCGKTGPRALDIYVPNGAIVPVRCDVDTTVGVTILAITVDSQELGVPVNATSRPVAIAAETETGLDDSAGITLATLDPNRFVYQNLDGTALSMGAGASALTANDINITTAATSGRQIGLSLYLTHTGTGAGGFHALKVRGVAEGTAIAADVNGIWGQTTLGTGSVLGSGYYACGVFAKVHVIDGAGNQAGDVVALRCSLGLDETVAGKTAMIRFDHHTIEGETPDYLFITAAGTDSTESIAFEANTAHGASATDKVGAIKVYFGNAAAARYIYVYSHAGQ